MKHLKIISLFLTTNLVTQLFAADLLSSPTVEEETPLTEASVNQSAQTCTENALAKFIIESETLKSTLKENAKNDLFMAHRDRTIRQAYDFFIPMVLMHVQHENYAQSYLDGRISWHQILGLAIAYDGYKNHAVDLKGYASVNEAFLTAVLNHYKNL
jgi:hypothetical protein